MKREILQDCDPFVALAGALLQRARDDARAGDLGALAWLVVAGAPLAARLHPSGDDMVLEFARHALAAVEAGSVKAHWGV
jgi:hypothetical protein